MSMMAPTILPRLRRQIRQWGQTGPLYYDFETDNRRDTEYGRDAYLSVPRPVLCGVGAVSPPAAAFAG